MVGIPEGIMSSVTWLKICAIAAAIRRQKSIKQNKNSNKVVLLAKSKLNSTEVLYSKVLIDSVISHDEFVSMINMLKPYDKMKEEIKNHIIV